MFKKVNWKDVGIRSLKTFIEAAIPLILTALTGIDYAGDGNTIKSVLIATLLSAAATGICAVWNGVINPLLNGIKTGPEHPEHKDDEEK